MHNNIYLSNGGMPRRARSCTAIADQLISYLSPFLFENGYGRQNAL